MRQALVAGAFVSSLVLHDAATPAALAQLTTAGIRGRVIDEAGETIAGVGIEMEFKGESRKKVARSLQSDKKGGFVRVGIPDGPWQITFSKPGYQTYVMEIHLSLGGFSEAGDVVLKPAPVAAPTVAIPGVAAAEPGAADAAAAEPDTSGESYAAAIDAARGGRYDEAEALLKEVLAQHPEAASAHYNLGYVYRMKRDWRSAEAEYLRVTELEPERRDAHVALAAVREADGRSQEAADGLTTAAAAFATDADFQYALGVTNVNAGRSADAAEALRKAIGLDPANAEAHYQLATVLVGQAKITEAVAMLEQYLAMTGQNAANLETAKALLGALKKK